MDKLFNDRAPPRSTVWYGHWWVDTKTSREIVFVVCRNNYYIPMDRCCTAEEKERWLQQVERKVWAVDVIDGLYEAIDVGMKKQVARDRRRRSVRLH